MRAWLLRAWRAFGRVVCCLLDGIADTATREVYFVCPRCTRRFSLEETPPSRLAEAHERARAWVADHLEHCHGIAR